MKRINLFVNCTFLFLDESWVSTRASSVTKHLRPEFSKPFNIASKAHLIRFLPIRFPAPCFLTNFDGFPSRVHSVKSDTIKPRKLGRPDPLEGDNFILLFHRESNVIQSIDETIFPERVYVEMKFHPAGTDNDLIFEVY